MRSHYARRDVAGSDQPLRKRSLHSWAFFFASKAAPAYHTGICLVRLDGRGRGREYTRDRRVESIVRIHQSDMVLVPQAAKEKKAGRGGRINGASQQQLVRIAETALHACPK